MLIKVPEVTLIFWIAKLGTTCFGEAFSDYVFFNDYIGRIKAILMGLALLLVCYAIQLQPRGTSVDLLASRYRGGYLRTMSADFLNKNLGMPLWASTLMLLALQSTVFIAWYATERTLNIHSITTHRRELFYWLTVLLTFALGNSGGRFRGRPPRLGTLASTLVLPRGHSRPPGWLEMAGAQRSPCLLAGLHHHPSPGASFRRLSSRARSVRGRTSNWNRTISLASGSCCSESSP